MLSQFLILADFSLDFLPVLAAVNTVLLQMLAPAPILKLDLEMPHDLLLCPCLLPVNQRLFCLLNGTDLATLNPLQMIDHPLILNTLPQPELLRLKLPRKLLRPMHHLNNLQLFLLNPTKLRTFLIDLLDPTLMPLKLFLPLNVAVGVDTVSIQETNFTHNIKLLQRNDLREDGVSVVFFDDDGD